MSREKKQDRHNTLRTTEVTADDIALIAESLSPPDSARSQAREMIEFGLTQVLVGVFEILNDVKSARLNGPVSPEEAEAYVSKLALCNKILCNVIEDWVTHDASRHLQISDDS